MAPSVGPTAASITILQTLDLLSSSFSAVAKAVDSQQFALWVGSGISFDRAPSLGKLIELTIEHLRSKITTNDEADKFAVGLKKILKLADLDDAAINKIDLTEEFTHWSSAKTITAVLWNKYSSMLDVRIKGEKDDYLLWDAVNVRNEYGRLTDPDCEHLAIAILVLEGAVSKIASANWDGLIEIAVEQLSPTGRNGVLQVIVDPQHVRDVAGRATLVKFHGCAVLCTVDPSTYRKFLVATKTQITNWPNAPTLSALVGVVQQVAVNNRAMMVGLSLQDANLQDTFSKARTILPWSWPCAPDAPWHVFCEDQLGTAQDAMLRVAYGDSYTPHEDDIQKAALLRAFAKPALTALAFHVVFSKLEALMRQSVGAQISPADADTLAQGLTRLRNELAAVAPSNKAALVVFLRQVVSEWSRAMTMYRRGETPAPDATVYQGISPLPLSQMIGDQNLSQSGIDRLAVALALLGRQVQHGGIKVQRAAGHEAVHGTIEATGVWAGAKPAQVYFVGSSGVVLKLIDQGAFEGDNVIILHSDDAWCSMMERNGAGRRSPTGVSVGAGKKIRHVSVSKLLADNANLPDLEQRFLEEMTL